MDVLKFLEKYEGNLSLGLTVWFSFCSGLLIMQGATTDTGTFIMSGMLGLTLSVFYATVAYHAIRRKLIEDLHNMVYDQKEEDR